MPQVALQRKLNRVTYRDLTYTFCTYCYNLIGIAKTERNLCIAEEAHQCPAMQAYSESEFDGTPR